MGNLALLVYISHPSHHCTFGRTRSPLLPSFLLPLLLRRLPPPFSRKALCRILPPFYPPSAPAPPPSSRLSSFRSFLSSSFSRYRNALHRLFPPFSPLSAPAPPPSPLLSSFSSSCVASFLLSLARPHCAQPLSPVNTSSNVSPLCFAPWKILTEMSAMATEAYWRHSAVFGVCVPLISKRMILLVSLCKCLWISFALSFSLALPLSFSCSLFLSLSLSLVASLRLRRWLSK